MLESNRESISNVENFLMDKTRKEENLFEDRNSMILGENILENKPVKKKKGKNKDSKKEKEKDKNKNKKGKREFNPEISESLRKSVGFLMTNEDRFAERNKNNYKSKKFNYKAKLSKLTAWEDRTEDKSKDKKKLKYKERVKLQNDMVNIQLSRVIWDKKHFFFHYKDDGAMAIVKKRAILLENILRANRADMAKMGFIDEEGKFDAEKFTEVLDKAFNETIAACDHYLETHSSHRNSFWGSRRKQKVLDLKKRLLSDQQKYKTAFFAIKLGAFDKAEDKITTPQNLVSSLSVVEIDFAEYQKEGNSTDVYKVKVTDQESGEVKEYYMKQNLPMLNKDMDGFLKRRISQLNKSKANREATKDFTKEEKSLAKASKLEENRMSKVNADDTDYKNGIEFLQLMKKTIDGAGLKEADEHRRRYAEFFRHNFDQLFKDLVVVNQKIRFLNDNLKESFSVWEGRAKSDEAAAYVVDLLRLNGISNDHRRLERLNEVAPAAFLKKKLNLDEQKDADLIEFMEKLDKQPLNVAMNRSAGEQKTGRLEALLRYTTGKEVELYGQVMENTTGNEGDMSQYNTMATGLLADKYGFKDEVVQTYIKTAEFDQWDGQLYSGTVTLQEIAHGEEWIEVCKRARQKKLKIRHTENSIRQLIRLQMFDTLCQQQDRHGRNFKCITREQNGVIYIESIKAYDHDQSLSKDNLKESFKEKKGKDGKLIESSKNCFLPSTLKVISKHSPEYRYVVNKYFGGKMNPPPTWMTSFGEVRYKDASGKNIRLNENLRSFVKAYGFTTSETQKFEHNEDKKKEIDYDQGRVALLNPAGIIWFERFDLAKHTHIRNISGSTFDVQSESKIKIKATGKEIKQGKTLDCDYFNIMRNVQSYASSLESIITDWDMNAPSPSLYEQQANAGKKVESPAKYLREGNKLKDYIKTMSLDRKIAFANNVKVLAKIAETYDFSEVVTRNDLMEKACFNHVNSKNNGVFQAIKLKDKDGKGFVERKGLFQAWLNETISICVDALSTDGDLVQIVSGNSAEPEELAQFKNENGDLEIPGLLHADREAYESVCQVVNDFENGTISEELKSKRLTDGAIEALYTRSKELKERYEYMRDRAEKILAIKYANEPKDSAYRKFFLDKDDYKKIGKMSDFAIDPGDSYLVQDNEHYLSCQKAFQDIASAGELKDKLDARRRIIKDPKRWNWIEKECPNSLQTDVEDRIQTNALRIEDDEYNINTNSSRIEDDENVINTNQRRSSVNSIQKEEEEDFRYDDEEEEEENLYENEKENKIQENRVEENKIEENEDEIFFAKLREANEKEESAEDLKKRLERKHKEVMKQIQQQMDEDEEVKNIKDDQRNSVDSNSSDGSY